MANKKIDPEIQKLFDKGASKAASKLTKELDAIFSDPELSADDIESIGGELIKNLSKR